MKKGDTAPGRRVAIVHDYLTQRGGAERVVLSLCRAFPDAPVYASLYDPDTTFPEFRGRDVRPLGLDRATPLRRSHRLALPLLPLAFRSSRVDADVVVCSSSGWAHGIRTGGRKVVYCHSPAKWLYRADDYLGADSSAGARAGLRALDPFLRAFDRRAAASADTYVANSTFIAAQIRDVYGIEAEVLCPPPGLVPDGPQAGVADVEPGFLLAVARLLPYKNVAQVVDAFRRLPASRLIVVGEGSERDSLAAGAPTNVRFLGEVSDPTLRWLYANCAGLVAASRDDFGLSPIEAGGFGKPVAALRWGGSLDTVIPGTTGVFFDRPEPTAIAEAVGKLRTHSWDSEAIKLHADSFSESRFVHRMQTIVGEAVKTSSRRHPKGAPTAPEAALTAASMLRLESSSAAAVAALREAGIRSILLKGPLQQDWLAPAGTPRVSCDIDLLVDPADVPASADVLSTLGYSHQPEVTPGVDTYSQLWAAPGRIPIEVHSTLSGAEPDSTWAVIEQETDTSVIAGQSVEIPAEPVRCLVVALHVAQHGPEAQGPLYDLERAAAVAGRGAWEHAATLARRTGSEVAFVTGLGLSPAGARVRDELGLHPLPLTERLALNLAGDEHGAAGFHWFVQQKGTSAKAAYVARKVVPPADFIRSKYPFARRGRLHLILAYVYRPIWIARWALPGFRAWRHSRQAVRSSRSVE